MSDTGTNTPKVHLTESHQLPDGTGAPFVNAPESTTPSIRSITLETRGATALASVIDIDRLYESPPGTSSQMVRALALLKQLCDFLAEANRADNPMDADQIVQRVQAALPKLFAFRSIGDGFGVIVNSLYYAFTNLRGTPLNSGQLNAVWRVLRELRAAPVMSLEHGIERAEELEEHGLEIDPADIGDLLEDAESARNE